VRIFDTSSRQLPGGVERPRGGQTRAGNSAAGARARVLIADGGIRQPVRMHQGRPRRSPSAAARCPTKRARADWRVGRLPLVLSGRVRGCVGCYSFRPFLVIPILIVLVSIGGVSADWTGGNRDVNVATVGGILLVPAFRMIVFRRKEPR
jgi:hypothetical protein